jgi:hypothetical protein
VKTENFITLLAEHLWLTDTNRWRAGAPSKEQYVTHITKFCEVHRIAGFATLELPEPGRDVTKIIFHGSESQPLECRICGAKQ